MSDKKKWILHKMGYFNIIQSVFMWLIERMLVWLFCTVIVIFRKRIDYENTENDIVQGEDEGETKKNT